MNIHAIDLSRPQVLEQTWCSLCGQASGCQCELTEQKIERIYKKVVDIIGPADPKPFVWKAAFHQAAVEEGIEPKSAQMSTIERMCNERATKEGLYD